MGADVYEENDFAKRPYQRNHGDRIRELRDVENLSQEKAAEIAGVDVTTFRRAENGESLLPAAAAIKLYLEFGYSLDWIYGTSEVAKDHDGMYMVDIRDIVRVKEGRIKISIKRKFYEALSHLEENADIKQLQLDEDYARLAVGIAKQRRRFSHYCNESSFYCADINAKEFQLKLKLRNIPKQEAGL